MKRAFVAALALVLVPIVVPAVSAHAVTGPTTLGGYTVQAQASVLQITEDYPTSSLHPLVEADLGYSSALLDSTRGHAVGAVLYPGAAGSNVGTLLGLLGVIPASTPPQVTSLLPLLNFRGDASIGTGPGPQTQTLNVGAATMTASVVPSAPDDQTSSASTQIPGVDLGLAGEIGASQSSTTINFDPDSEAITANTQSSVVGVNLASVLSIGAVTANATATSEAGQTPTITGSTTFSDVQVAGQEAYIDGQGLHLGAKANPAGGLEDAVVNSILKGAGITIATTNAQTVVQGGVTYYYPAGLFMHIKVPGDSNGDVQTISLGNAAVAMTVTAIPSSPAPSSGNSSGSGFSSDLSPNIPSSSSSLALPLSIPPNPATPLPALTAPVSAPAPGVVLPTHLVDTASHGIGAAWLIMLAVLALAGAIALPLVPRLLREAAPAPCVTERDLET